LRQRLPQRADAEAVTPGQVGEFELGLRGEGVSDDVGPQSPEQILPARRRGIIVAGFGVLRRFLEMDIQDLFLAMAQPAGACLAFPIRLFN
jgi:hypothetical protein